MILLFIIQLVFSFLSILYWIDFQVMLHYQSDEFSVAFSCLIISVNLNLLFIIIETINTSIFLILKKSVTKLILVFVTLKLILIFLLFFYIREGEIFLNQETVLFVTISEIISIITYLLLKMNKKN